jgi:hydrogenase nickel incorporation protein HypB
MHEVAVGADLLAHNDATAQHNRQHFVEHGVYVLNIMSAPGAGKTTLLECTVKALKDKYKLAVIEGDVQTSEDAQRIEACGVPAVQINTGSACHLDARMIHKNLSSFDLDELDLLIIENVGNLVCPAEFDLGEHDKVMLFSVTEGADKPKKYPLMFHVVKAMVLNKIDLLPHVDFDLERARRDSRALNLDLEVFEVSARNGDGLDGWYKWIESRIERVKNSRG